MSPFLDVRHDVEGCPIRELTDVITTDAIQGAARLYCPEVSRCDDPLASPLVCKYLLPKSSPCKLEFHRLYHLADVEGTPPLMISAGVNEILYPSIVDFYMRVKKRNPGELYA